MTNPTDDLEKQRIIRIFMKQWETLLDELDAYKRIESVILIFQLRNQDPLITPDHYATFFSFIDSIYRIAARTIEVQDMALSKLNRFSKLPSNVDKVVMWVSTIEDDKDFGPILELKRELDNNELAREIYRWGKEANESREGKENKLDRHLGPIH